MPSPFIGISNQSSNLASSGASDLNNILTQSLLGTPIQNPNFINQQPQVTQQTTNLDNMLNNQVAQLLQLENEKKIQALTEMLKVAIQQQQQQQQQLQAQQLQQQIQQQLQVQQLQAQQLQAQQLQAQQLQAQQLQAQQLQAQLFSLNNSSNQQQSLTLENLLIQDQQQKIALSNGLLMNPIKRIVPPVSQVDPRLNVKIDQTRKELLNLDGSKKKDEILEEMSFNQQRQKFATMATQPLSLINLIESQNTNPLTNNLNPQLQSQIQTQIQTQIQSQIQPSNQQPKSSPNLSSLLQQQMENMTLQNNSNNLEHTPSAGIITLSL